MSTFRDTVFPVPIPEDILAQTSFDVPSVASRVIEIRSGYVRLAEIGLHKLCFLEFRIDQNRSSKVRLDQVRSYKARFRAISHHERGI